MKTSPLVVSVTDELVADIERRAIGYKQESSACITHAELVALLAERAELLRDAGRYRWLRERCFGFSHDEAGRGISTSRWGEWNYDTPQGHCAQMDDAIDDAMQSEAKP